MEYAPSVRTDYNTLRNELKERLSQAANNFVEIGYLLHIARDTDILRASGYGSMGAFAKAEYGLTPDTASRFISVYEKFGDEEGHLRMEYKDHSYTKLVEMLQLPNALAEELPADISREEIRELRQQVRAEEAISPIEVMLEDRQAAGGRTDLQRTLCTLFEQEPELYVALSEKAATKEAVLTTFIDGGIGTKGARVPGLGPMVLSFKGIDQDPVLVNARQDEKEKIDWEDFLNAVEKELHTEGEAEIEAGTPREAWELKYGRTFPEKTEKIAPAQLKEPEAEKKSPGKPREEEKKKPERKEIGYVPIREEKEEPEAAREIMVTRAQEQRREFSAEEDGLLERAAGMKKLMDAIISKTNAGTWTAEEVNRAGEDLLNCHNETASALAKVAVKIKRAGAEAGAPAA